MVQIPRKRRGESRRNARRGASSPSSHSPTLPYPGSERTWFASEVDLSPGVGVCSRRSKPEDWCAVERRPRWDRVSLPSDIAQRLEEAYEGPIKVQRESLVGATSDGS